MARPIVLSNGKLHVGLNEFGMVHEFYFPYVGFENHSAGGHLRHRVGVWVEGSVSWLRDPNEWTYKFKYHKTELIGHLVAKNDRLGVILEFDDLVDSETNTFVRNVQVINMHDRPREIRLFMHQAFVIGDSRSNTDTAQYIPNENALLHYRGRRAFVISGLYNNEPFDQHTVGLFDIENREGTYKDADDGELSTNNVEHGRVDSTIRFKLNVDSHGSARVHYWIACGMTIRDAINVHNKIRIDGINKVLERTSKWWREWLKPSMKFAEKLDPEFRPSFTQSLMIIKSQIDSGGAIIASTDTSMLNYSRDAYAYNWPRDGAYTIWPLIRMGYQEEAYKFFDFTKRCLQPEGYLMHKYRADGALGSSWHSYVHDDGVVAPPIQVDETALPLYIFTEYYKKFQEQEILDEFYDSMVVPMANFLTAYIDDVTGLPKASYDLWEQLFSMSTYTTATAYAALMAASDLAIEINDQHNSVKWRSAANDIQIAAHKYLYNQNRKVFYRGVNVKYNQVVYDEVIDNSSVFGSYIFGLFDRNGQEIKSSIETIKHIFGINNGAIGLPRCENDDYRRVSSDINGNLWFITSLWLAQYYLDNDKTDEAYKIIRWTRDSALETGIMAEQIDPITNQIVSPAPLTWTHAEYLATLLDTIQVKKNE